MTCLAKLAHVKLKFLIAPDSSFFVEKIESGGSRDQELLNGADRENQYLRTWIQSRLEHVSLLGGSQPYAI